MIKEYTEAPVKAIKVTRENLTEFMQKYGENIVNFSIIFENSNGIIKNVQEDGYILIDEVGEFEEAMDVSDFESQFTEKIN